ncbi:MAG: biotin/lipoyl-binding protein, partial [Pseudomonadota bacterium]|nr:biotin/lipoyl-binding protein [Pseudomonadota bacterium]
MKSTSPINKTRLMAGVAAVVVLGGAGIYAMTRSPSEAPASAAADPAEGEEGHTEAAEAGDGALVLSAAQIEAANLSIVGVTGGGGGETRLSGRVEPMVDARAAVAASVGGRVERVLVAPGQSVRAGQPLAILVSADAATLRADADAAQANAVAAEQAHSREESLADQGVVARRDAEVAHAQALSAQASARAARARASAAGSPDASGRLSVTSP